MYVRRSFTGLGCLFGLILVAACSYETPLTPRQPDPSDVRVPASSASAISLDPVELLAEGIAGALSSPGVQNDVIQLLRASPLVEHKVRLDELLVPESGVVRAAAAAIGMSEAAFASLVPETPFEFYLADRTQRRTWKGGGSIAVIVTWDQETGYLVTTDGSTLEGNVAALAAQERDALFAIHPAESMAYRFGWRESTSKSAVIENISDPKGGVIISYRDSSGRSRTLDIAREELSTEEAIQFLSNSRTFESSCSTPECGGDPGGGGEDPSSVLQYWANLHITEPLGSVELEFKSWGFSSTKLSTPSPTTLRMEGVDRHDLLIADPATSNYTCNPYPGTIGYYAGCLPGWVIFQWQPPVGHSVRAEVWETDFGGGGDDWYGIRYWSFGDGGQEQVFDGYQDDWCFDEFGYSSPCSAAQIGFPVG